MDHGLGKWLRSLGLTWYQALFHENDIDTGLAELTESDLTGLGVSLGHRRRLTESDREHGSTELQRNAHPPCSLEHLRTPPGAADSR